MNRRCHPKCHGRLMTSRTRDYSGDPLVVCQPAWSKQSFVVENHDGPRQTSYSFRDIELLGAVFVLQGDVTFNQDIAPYMNILRDTKGVVNPNVTIKHTSGLLRGTRSRNSGGL